MVVLIIIIIKRILRDIITESIWIVFLLKVRLQAQHLIAAIIGSLLWFLMNPYYLIIRSISCSCRHNTSAVLITSMYQWILKSYCLMSICSWKNSQCELKQQLLLREYANMCLLKERLKSISNYTHCQSKYQWVNYLKDHSRNQ